MSNDDDDGAQLLAFVEALYDASGFGSSSVAADGFDGAEDDALDQSGGEPSAPESVDAAQLLQLEPPRAEVQHGSEKRPPAKWDSNKARDARKGELVYLRKRVADLEAELVAVQSKRTRLAATATALGGGGRAAGDASREARGSREVAKLWKEIARRQNEQRARAECENVRLKLVLENQLKVAKSLESILHRKSTMKGFEEFEEPTKKLRPTASATDAEVFKTLLSEVELLFSKVDSVFEANGLAHSEASVMNARVRSDAHTGVSLEISASKLLPFSLREAGDAAWLYYTSAKVKAPYRRYAYNANSFAETHGDTAVEDFVLKLNANDTDANLRCKQILRRRVEHDRVVIVWRSAAEAVEFSDEPVSGVRFYQDGYVVVKRPSSVPGDHTLLQSCCIFTPDVSRGPAHHSHPRIGAITDFLLVATAAYISSAHQMIENVLLEQALRTSSSSPRVQALH